MPRPCGCTEYLDVSRRQFLGLGGAAALSAALAPAWLPRVSYARPGRPTARDILVSIFLRGGADGLTLCVPHGDPDYYNARPTINIPRPDGGDQFAATDLDGFFGLAPAMASLLQPYLAGHLLFVHATGSVDTTRSHFDAMHFMEVGKPRDPALFTGWIGRHLLTVPPLDADALVRAIGVSNGLPRSLVGAPRSLPFPDLDDSSLNGREETKDERLEAIGDMYGHAGSLLRASAESTINTLALLDAIDFAGYIPAHGAVYPDSEFGYSLKCCAALIKARVNVEALTLDLGSWDTHESQGPRDGYMAYLMADFAGALAAFHLDVITDGPDVTLAAMSEFGRVVAENGSRGCDHGHGNVMMLMGRHIAGGRVLSQWPGLNPDLLYEGQDLAITIDYRDILAEIVQNRLANSDLPFVFPDFTPTFRGVTL
ncbi:MAG: DUF1501 domain-containing protein [Phycisphaerales bacterium]|nr:DUF1501 domain-containing protein [Phycisphaerales bacterium]